MTRVFILAVVLCFASAIQATESHIHSIQRLTLSTEYYSEGAGFGDVPHDPNLLHLYRYAPEPVVVANKTTAIVLLSKSENPQLRQFISRRLASK
ncbi:MAG: hypothetical protein OSB55_06240 [Verrucomicrobiota bacterium]|nr:hypothetical protein [Verrucomicrobiota bacterium]